MRSNRHPTLARFEEHSLALFAALVMSSTTVTAQTRPLGVETAAAYADASGAVAKPVMQVAQRSNGAEQAFGRADTNGDGKLSRDEAQRLPAVWERFDTIDTNADRLISREEFHRGIAN